MARFCAQAAVDASGEGEHDGSINPPTEKIQKPADVVRPSLVKLEPALSY
jgi:hypothetical protein